MFVVGSVYFALMVVMFELEKGLGQVACVWGFGVVRSGLMTWKCGFDAGLSCYLCVCLMLNCVVWL